MTPPIWSWRAVAGVPNRLFAFLTTADSSYRNVGRCVLEGGALENQSRQDGGSPIFMGYVLQWRHAQYAAYQKPARSSKSRWPKGPEGRFGLPSHKYEGRR